MIAEIGGNHEGSFSLAKKQCSLALESGVDCVKFQIYMADSLVNCLLSPERHTHFRRFELSQDEHIYLAHMCKEARCDYLSSVWDLSALEWIDPYLNCYKIGSGDLTALPLLREFSRRGKPILLSTGLSTIGEVKWAVEQIRATNPIYNSPGMITLLQCTSMYPITLADANLSVISGLSSISHVSVGYSDHTVGSDALYAAAVIGATVLEFHFTDKREGREFRDHKVSLTKEEVVDLRNLCNKAQELRGSAEKLPLTIEVDQNHHISFRRAIFPSKKLDKGTIITEHDLVCLRPKVGICASEIGLVIGKRLNRSVDYLQVLDLSFFD